MVHVLPYCLPALKKKNLSSPQKLWKNPKFQNAGYTPKLFNVQRIRKSQQLVTGKTSNKSQTWDDSNVEIIRQNFYSSCDYDWTPTDLRCSFSGVIYFCLSYYSWGSWDKNPREYTIMMFHDIRENALKTNGKIKILREIKA